MIPKKAYFYWEGPKMSDLRAMSIETFRRLNPGWELTMLPPLGQDDIVGDSLRHRVLRSDLARLWMLRQGGAYFDTDILFLKPIPESWLSSDLAMTVDLEGQCASVGWMLTSEKAAPFIESVLQAAAQKIASKALLSYQSLGIKLWNEWSKGMDVGSLALRSGLEFRTIPVAAFMPVSWGFVEHLWTPSANILPEGTIGIHWYGGDALSKELEHSPPEGSIMARYIAEAIPA